MIFFQNKSFSKNLGFNCVRFAVIVLPAWENNLSLEVEVTEIDKYFLAKWDKIGNLSWFPAHHLKGSVLRGNCGNERYSLISFSAFWLSAKISISKELFDSNRSNHYHLIFVY